MNSQAIDNKKIKQILLNSIESKLDCNQEKDFIFDDIIKYHEYVKKLWSWSLSRPFRKWFFDWKLSLVTAGIRQNKVFYPIKL